MGERNRAARGPGSHAARQARSGGVDTGDSSEGAAPVTHQADTLRAAAAGPADGDWVQPEAGRRPPDGEDDRDVPADTAAAVAYWHRQDPRLHPAEIATRIGRSERTVRRYWSHVTATGGRGSYRATRSPRSGAVNVARGRMPISAVVIGGPAATGPTWQIHPDSTATGADLQPPRLLCVLDQQATTDLIGLIGHSHRDTADHTAPAASPASKRQFAEPSTSPTHTGELCGTGDQPDSRADGGSWLSLSDSVGVGEHVDGEAGVRRHQVGLRFERDHPAVPAHRRVLAAE
jgi:hypothetical protein